MICLPELAQPQCESVSLRGVKMSQKEKCLPITRTVCTEATGESYGVSYFASFIWSKLNWWRLKSA